KLLAKGVRYFKDLPPDKLRIIASDITRGRLLLLPDDIRQYGMNPGNLEVARAVRMSASLPFFFDPVVIKKRQRADDGACKKSPRVIYVVDGGILSNFPLWIFDKTNKEDRKMTPVLGFNLVGKNEARPKEIHGPLSMFQALFATMMGAHDERYIDERNRFRTIKIPTLGVQTTQFDISKEEAMRLYEAGKDAAERFFDKWSLSSYVSQYELHVAKYI
ncbi:MAG TPA: patatin-like phospholipase family protein, partial [Bacilli bacterium]